MSNRPCFGYNSGCDCQPCWEQRQYDDRYARQQEAEQYEHFQQIWRESAEREAAEEARVARWAETGEGDPLGDGIQVQADGFARLTAALGALGTAAGVAGPAMAGLVRAAAEAEKVALRAQIASDDSPAES